MTNYKCYRCGKEAPAAYIRCPSCGEVGGIQEEREKQPDIVEIVRFCHECGQQVKAQGQYCDNCGTKQLI